MFDHLTLHESARHTLTALATRPPQGVLLVGAEGAGKLTVTMALASHITDHSTDIRVIAPDDKGTLSIDTIRELYKSTRSKQSGRQVVIIERADRMSLEAENAFLKLLEEPREGLIFILTALHTETLLPTILSRIQQVSLPPVADEAIRRLVMSKQPGIAQNDLSQLVFLAQGRPGSALKLLGEGALPKQRERMQVVKQLIGAKPHERFVLSAKLSSSREECVETLQAMSRVVEVQLGSANTPAQATHWTTIANALEDTLQAIHHNGNVRAQLLRLFSRY